jgi:hypothetical protein
MLVSLAAEGKATQQTLRSDVRAGRLLTSDSAVPRHRVPSYCHMVAVCTPKVKYKVGSQIHREGGTSTEGSGSYCEA